MIAPTPQLFNTPASDEDTRLKYVKTGAILVWQLKFQH